MGYVKERVREILREAEAGHDSRVVGRLCLVEVDDAGLQEEVRSDGSERLGVREAIRRTNRDLFQTMALTVGLREMVLRDLRSFPIHVDPAARDTALTAHVRRTQTLYREMSGPEPHERARH